MSLGFFLRRKDGNRSFQTASKAHDYLGAILNALGRFEEAETHLRRAIALNPQEKNAHFNLGNTLCEQGDMRKPLRQPASR